MTDAPVNVLWTSGWDSTYRVASLLREGKTIQPWYVKDSARRSTKVELRTMDSIRDALQQRDPSVRERLLPTRAVAIADIPADPDTTRRYRALLARSPLGNQYDWLSRLAQSEGISLELSIHRDDKAHDFLADSVETDGGGSYRLRADADDDLSIFAPFTFPLFDISKVDMQNAAEAGGFRDVMEMTWFCFNPMLDATPCGHCNPCRYTVGEGLGRRVPASTPRRKMEAKALLAAWRIRSKARQLVARG